MNLYSCLDEKALAFCIAATGAASVAEKGGRLMGLMPDRHPLRDKGTEVERMKLDADFFCHCQDANPKYSGVEFECMYYMPREAYEYVRQRVVQTDDFSVQEQNPTGKRRAKTEQKITASFLMLAKGCSEFSFRKEFGWFEQVILDCEMISSSSNAELIYRMAAAFQHK